jgi:tRNA (guanine-N7-)-methyltransferase
MESGLPRVLRPYETTWEDWVLGGGVEAAFADRSLPLEVEIGPGEDDFLLESAVSAPERNWLGIEYSRKRVARYVRKVERRAPGLGNLRLAWRPAGDVVAPFLTPGRVHAYHVHFPDPWPKKHHGRYRLLQPEFLREVEASLVPGGTVHVATDHPSYVEEMLLAFAETGLERVIEGDTSRARAPTLFEERWRAMGKAIYRVDYRRPS